MKKICLPPIFCKAVLIMKEIGASPKLQVYVDYLEGGTNEYPTLMQNTLTYIQPWTYTSVFTDRHGLCVCVSTNYLTMDYPLPLWKSMIGTFFLHHAYEIFYRLAVLWQSWTSMVGVCPWLHSAFSDLCPWLKVLTNAHTHTLLEPHVP